ncbi:hypothetical protein BASA81_009688 [Batrachochytrium salamandrivorans]|nr:hypothetical protein BASA81_009688 [Batrachochytrium salamandrivorans]
MTDSSIELDISGRLPTTQTDHLKSSLGVNADPPISVSASTISLSASSATPILPTRHDERQAGSAQLKALPSDDGKSSNLNASSRNRTIKPSAQDLVPSGLSEQTNEGISKVEHISVERRIIAEDSKWNLAPIKRLSDLCIKTIVFNFEKNPILNGLSEKCRDRVISDISIDIPLHIAAPLIPDESYWLRRAKKRFKLANVQDHGKSWKRLYFELYLRERLENYIPYNSSQETDTLEAKESMLKLLEEAKLSAPFIVNIQLSQLRPAVMGNEATHDGVRRINSISPAVFVDVAAKSIQFDTTAVYTTKEAVTSALMGRDGDMNSSKLLGKDAIQTFNNVHPDHVNLASVLGHLTGLQEFSVYYGIKDCGFNFSWTSFGMTLNDSLMLSEYLRSSQLQKLTVHASAIDDDKCRLLCHALLSNTTLTHLDLSHNKISDGGAKGISKVLSSSTCVLTTLRISNNKIGLAGVQSIGKSLASNTTLRCLDLRLNLLGDEGGRVLCAAISKNKTLVQVDFSGNGLGFNSVMALSALLKCNGSALVSLDLSCNKLGNYGRTVASKETACGSVGQISETLVSGAVGDATQPCLPSSVIDAIVANGNTQSTSLNDDQAGKMVFEAISTNKVSDAPYVIYYG